MRRRSISDSPPKRLEGGEGEEGEDEAGRGSGCAVVAVGRGLLNLNVSQV